MTPATPRVEQSPRIASTPPRSVLTPQSVSTPRTEPSIWSPGAAPPETRVPIMIALPYSTISTIHRLASQASPLSVRDLMDLTNTASSAQAAVVSAVQQAPPPARFSEKHDKDLVGKKQFTMLEFLRDDYKFSEKNRAAEDKRKKKAEYVGRPKLAEDFLVTILNSATGKFFPVSVSEGMTMGEVAERVGGIEGLPVERVHLLWSVTKMVFAGGKAEVEEGRRKVKDVGIKGGDLIVLSGVRPVSVGNLRTTVEGAEVPAVSHPALRSRFKLTA